MTGTISYPSSGAAPIEGTSPFLEVQGLTVQFATGRGFVSVVENVEFSVDRGETLGIVGESGSGKSVTSLSIMGLIPSPPGRIAAGRILIEGRDILGLSESEMRRVRGDDISMIFQEPLTSMNPAFRVGNQIAEAVRAHRKVSKRASWDRAVDLLDLVGIPEPRERAEAYPHQFSGGMMQRAMIASALAAEPKLLIADEPTTALDVTIQAQILDLLGSLQEEFDMALIFVTHDLGVVADISDRVVVMYAGEVVESAPVDELFRSPKHPYTEGLLEAMPQVGARTGRLQPILGVVPAPGSLPDQCRFGPRCPYVTDACRQTAVPITHVDGRSMRCVRHAELELKGAR